MTVQEINANGLEVLQRRYLAKDEQGQPMETVEQMFHRVAETVAKADTKYDGAADWQAVAEKFEKMITDLRFMPNSPTLMNAGRPLGQLSACFVLPVGDSMEEIFDAVKYAALIHKSGGGTGFSFSRLRPQGAMVKSTGGVASGPVSFMRVFNMATEAVKQGGTRRGANMGILRVDHPDIRQFIHCKSQNSDITNFNISVGITDAFMRALAEQTEYPLIDPKSGQAVGRENAQDIFEQIVEAAWRNGEPGIIFLDRLNRDNPLPSLGEIESTNPCGEQPLLPYESCNLGSINLVKMLRQTESGWEIDYPLLAETVADAVHFLDNVIDVNNYPLPMIEETTKAGRKIGLGVMGFADMLLYLNVAYNSPEAVTLAGEIMGFIQSEGRKASRLLAQSRGAFPLFAQSIYRDEEPLRNATITTIAPTGTISMICGVSSGVEPVFAYVYQRNVMDGTKFLEVNPVLRRVLRERGLDNEETLKEIAASDSLRHIPQLPEDIRRVFVAAHDVTPEQHVQIQAAFQQYTDNAVSKTVNFPASASKEDVHKTYLAAYDSGCKGVTIYRDGSREAQVLNRLKPEEAAKAENLTQTPAKVSPRPRPVITQGFTERVKIGCGNLYITVNYDDSGICEVFTSTGKAGGCPSQSEATARLASIALRSGLDVKEIYEQLKGIRCPSTIRQQGLQCTSCPDAIAKVLAKVDAYIKNGHPACGLNAGELPKGKRQAMDDLQVCPDCGAKLEHEGGCVTCRSCGFSRCG
ncbi:MAG: vitamin B12-dependent ribonucleotide reductase [Firmicutes bacterium]|nr:vitamin B12-dependent ribonucleotide reductase [Bacillota bacterium]